MEDWMRWLLNIGGTLFGANEQNRAQTEYEGATDQQIADSLRVAGQVGPETLATYDDSAGRGLNELFGLRDRQQAGARDITRGFQDRYTRAEEDLRGYGDQMRMDIDEGATREQGQWRLNPLSRGSTVSPLVSGGIERRRTAEQRRLGDDLTRQRIDILSRLDSDKLASMQYGMGLDAQNTGNLSNWFGTSAANRSNIVGRGYDTFLDTLTGINRVPPPQSMLPYQLGANSVQSPSAPSGASSFFGAAAPGLGAAAGAAAATIFIGICIGEDSLITTLDGEKPLRDIRVGELVMASDGEWTKVIAKHLSMFGGVWNDVYGKLTLDNHSIVVSRDHVVDGRRADEWIEVSAKWEPCQRMQTGDLLLEDNKDYMANGFEVRSLLSLRDMPVLMAREPLNQLVGA